MSEPARMNRAASCFVRVMLAGAILTVVVSWSLAAWAAFASSEVNRPPFDSRFPPLGISAPADWELRTWVPRRGFGLRHDIVTEMEWMGSKLGMMQGQSNRYMERAASGWPIPCLQWATEDDTEPGALLRGLPVLVPHCSWPERRLPLVPLWVPFLLDVLIYAGAIVAARTWFVSVRGHRRTKRGLCPWCAYPRGTAETCSECGGRLNEPKKGL